MTRRLIPVLAPLALFVVLLAEPSGARTPKPTVALMNATSNYLIGGVTNGRWVSADTLKTELPESAAVRSLSLGGERSLGTKNLSASQPPDICSWNWQYGDLGGGDDPLRVVGATWPLLPRPVKRLDANGGTYRGTAVYAAATTAASRWRSVANENSVSEIRPRRRLLSDRRGVIH